MVLSLPFVLAIIGAGVGLVVGILIFGQISDAITCPAPASGGGGEPPTTFAAESYDNLGTLGSAEDAVYAESEVITNFLPAVTGRINEAVVQEGMSSLDANGEIYLGTTPSAWWFMSGSGQGNDLISFSIWVNGDLQGSAEYPVLSNFERGSETDGVLFVTDSGRLRVSIEDDNSLKISAAFLNFTTFLQSEPPDNGQWHLLTISYDKSITAGNTNMEYCLDGTQDNPSTLGTTEGCVSGSSSTLGGTVNSWTSSNNPPVDYLTVGSDGDHNRNCTGGSCVTENTFKVDDFGIWNGYRLTHTDIENLWNGGLGSPANTISSSNLVGYWSFDESTANNVVVVDVDTDLPYNTLGTSTDGFLTVSAGATYVGQQITTAGEEITSLTINNINNNGNDAGTLIAEIYSGVSSSTSLDASTLLGTSINTLALDGGNAFNSDLDFTFTFDPPITVDGSNIWVGIHIQGQSGDVLLPIPTSDVGDGVALTENFVTSLNWALNTDGAADILMKIDTVGSSVSESSGIGSEQCEQAKDTAWTVIGIMPVALFFGLFALFSSFQRPT